jgi:CMP-N,N'-diacetyllegionaminic acid synthase
MSKIKIKPICFIPARGGSKGVKCKNIKKLDGIPLIVNAIKLAKNSKIFDKIVVSTDDQIIAKIAKKSGADVFIRSKKLATDESSTDEVLLDAIPRLLSMDSSLNTLVNLDCTVPFVTKKDLKGLINLLEKTDCDTTCLVYKQHHNPYFNIFEPDSKGFLKISKKKIKKISSRQKAPIVYQLIGVFAINISRFLSLKKIYMPKTLPYEIPSERGLMIDNEFEFQIADCVAKKIIKLK